MKLYRVINQETGLFIRDDFSFDQEAGEIGLEVDPAQGLFQPKWNGEFWVEGADEDTIAAATPSLEPEKTDEQLLEELSDVVKLLKERGLM
jgi:hypothetical protein